ncbi:hypothetical protein EDB19DRAFT_1820081, partial [Suillus lakei]
LSSIFSWFLTSVQSAILTMHRLSPTLHMHTSEATFKTISKTLIPPLPSSAKPLHCIRRVTPIMHFPFIISLEH